MKTILALLLLSASAFADDCCTGSCWTTGCCDPRQRCDYQEPSKKYNCTNVGNAADKIVVLKTGNILQQITAKPVTTFSEILSHE